MHIRDFLESLTGKKEASAEREIARDWQSAAEEAVANSSELLAMVEKQQVKIAVLTRELIRMRIESGINLPPKVEKAYLDMFVLFKTCHDHGDEFQSDPYELLGVSKSDSFSDITAKYRFLAGIFHPDTSYNFSEEFSYWAGRSINIAYSRIKEEMGE